MSPDPDALDNSVRAALARHDRTQATALVLDALGSDVLRTIHARFRASEATADVFAMFAEDLHRGLLKFSFRCALRVWVFVLARNAGSRYLDRELRNERKHVPLSDAPELALCVDALRTKTLPLLDTERERRLAVLRAGLSDDDQLLLTLRVDRELDFMEIARVFLGDADAAAESVQREAARLRKRFQLVKERLRQRWSSSS